MKAFVVLSVSAFQKIHTTLLSGLYRNNMRQFPVAGVVSKPPSKVEEAQEVSESYAVIRHAFAVSSWTTEFRCAGKRMF